MLNPPEKMVAIVGGSCSGKTELETGLRAELGQQLTIFPFDDMFVGAPALEGVEVTGWEDPSLYRWDDFFEAMIKLKLGASATIAANSRESTEQGITTRVIEPRPIVVAAGFLALHDEAIRALYTDTIYIELPENEIVRRRKARAKPGSPWDTDEYINIGLLPGHREFVVPQRRHANHIIDGMQSREDLASEVVGILLD